MKRLGTSTLPSYVTKMIDQILELYLVKRYNNMQGVIVLILEMSTQGPREGNPR